MQVCLEGPKSKIDDTQFSQPALFVGGLCAVEKLKAENPAAYEGVSCTAGLSLGEYTALVFAGVLSFEDGLKVRLYVAAPVSSLHFLRAGDQGIERVFT